MRLIHHKKFKTSGFTLVELVTVIMLLGIVSVGAGGIIKMSSQIFVDVTNRDQLVSSVRFAVERINRDIREALPNSAKELAHPSGGVCIEYVPINVSTLYLDIPVLPETPTDLLSVIKFDISLYKNTSDVVVYPLSNEDVYDSTRSKRYSLDASHTLVDSGNEWQLKLDSAINFAQDSPTSRIFLVDAPVSYCAEANGELNRYSNYGFDSNILAGTKLLMAEGVELAESNFQVDDANLYRSSLVHINLQFSKNSEFINFYNEVQVKNVP